MYSNAKNKSFFPILTFNIDFVQTCLCKQCIIIQCFISTPNATRFIRIKLTFDINNYLYIILYLSFILNDAENNFPQIRIVICDLNSSRAHANYMLINHIYKSHVTCDVCYASDEKVNS